MRPGVFTVNGADAAQSKMMAEAVRRVFPGVRIVDTSASALERQMTDDELVKHDFSTLRQLLLTMYVDCSGCGTVDELIARYKEEFPRDRMSRPLAIARKADKARLALRGGYVLGLRPCGRPDCRVTEDGYTAFDVCAGCKSRAYCSRTCQVLHWKQAHKHACADELAKSEQNKARGDEFAAMAERVAEVLPASRSKKGKK